VAGRLELVTTPPPLARATPGTSLLLPLRQRSTAPVRQANHRRVASALSGVLLAGPHQAERLASARAALAAHADRQVVLLLVSSGGGGASATRGALSGLYAVLEDDAAAAALAAALAALPGGGGAAAVPAASILAARIFGSGPPCVTAPMVNALLKFDTVSRAFRDVASHSLTPTTDALAVDALHAHRGSLGGGPTQLRGTSTSTSD